MTKSVRIGAKSSFLLLLSASVLYAIGVQGIRSGPGPSSFDGLASLFGMERRAESERIQSPAVDMTVGEPAVAVFAPAVAEADAGADVAPVIAAPTIAQATVAPAVVQPLASAAPARPVAVPILPPSPAECVDLVPAALMILDGGVGRGVLGGPAGDRPDLLDAGADGAGGVH